ncbi:MAG TPA: ABC transporter permease [Ignavibacteriales bacterium]|nr:ABC transporter permease [Ignavibacteriales bacterium]
MRILLSFIKKELLQIRRDVRLSAIILVAPIIQLILLGYAATLDIKVVHTAILDYDHSQMSRKFIQKVQASKYFKIDKYIFSQKDINDNLKSGIDIIFIFYPNFEKNFYQTRNLNLQIIVDATDGNKASVITGYTINLVNSFANYQIENLNNIIQYNRNNLLINYNPKLLYNPYLEARYFMLPGILGLLLMIINIALMSMAIVKEKEVGTLEQIIVTPIKKYHFILGKSIPFILLSFIPLTIQLAVIHFWFGIEIKGNLLFIFIFSLLFIVSSVGLGLLVSTITKTQFQAMSISFFGIMLPMIYISGFAFPVENMPKIIQYFSELLPIKHFLILIRGTILQGSTFDSYLSSVIKLTVEGIIIIIFSILNFRKRFS